MASKFGDIFDAAVDNNVNGYFDQTASLFLRIKGDKLVWQFSLDDECYLAKDFTFEHPFGLLMDDVDDIDAKIAIKALRDQADLLEARYLP